jgi:hypothetical protein
MPSTYSPNLALELIGTGDQAGTWGNTTNTNLGTLIEQAISGYEVQTLTSGTTLTLTIPNGATGVARNMYLEFTGNGSTVIVPSNKKLYFVYNNCTSGTITFKVAGQTGVDIPNGQKQILVSNGTDIQAAAGNSLEGLTNTSVTALGVNAANSVTTALNVTAIGHNAFSSYSQNFNTFVGSGSGRYVNNEECTGIGYEAGRGAAAGATGSGNTSVGSRALQALTSGGSNTAVGVIAGDAITTANWNSHFGAFAGTNVTTGVANTFIGYNSGASVSTGTTNSALGDSAYNSGNHSNSTCIGFDSAVTGSNQVQLGNSSTTTYVYGSVVDRASDIRDKADVQDTNLGLNFIMALRPVMYRWDYREDYRPPKPDQDASDEEWAEWREACKLSNLTHDGTHKRVRFHQGLIAQEVKAVMDSLGTDFGGYKDGTIDGGEDRVTLAYGELIAPLIKAIQELKAEFDEYKSTHP